MMAPVHRIDEENADPVNGSVVYDPPKALWNLSMILMACAFAPATASVESVLTFSILTYFSLLIGHSVGMHRMMIHGTFKSPRLVEQLLIYTGVIVGMSGPHGILRVHDLRDWAQRQQSCHDFFSHNRNYFLDIWWQLTCKFRFDNPPVFLIEEKYSNDAFYIWLEKTWRYHQLPLAALLYLVGGWSFVVWGIFVRVSVSVIGHWTITYFCHNPGPGKWRVKKASVQASNIPWLGLITYGECWHNNHHAFPESARIGIEPGQSDPAWWCIKAMSYLGMANSIGTPRPESLRDDLIQVNKCSDNGTLTQ